MKVKGVVLLKLYQEKLLVPLDVKTMPGVQDRPRANVKYFVASLFLCYGFNVRTLSTYLNNAIHNIIPWCEFELIG